MQIQTGKKHIGICILICSLLLTCCSGFFISNGVVSSDWYSYLFNSSSIGSGHSSMGGGTNLWHIDYSGISNISTGLFVSSAKPSQSPLAKTIFNILFSLITVQIICLIYSSRLAGSLCSQYDSIGIALYLHKTDGMK